MTRTSSSSWLTCDARHLYCGAYGPSPVCAHPINKGCHSYTVTQQTHTEHLLCQVKMVTVIDKSLAAKPGSLMGTTYGKQINKTVGHTRVVVMETWVLQTELVKYRVR